MPRHQPKRVRFLSTFEPATTFYRELLPRLDADGADVEVVLSRTEYRGGRRSLSDALSGTGVHVTETPSASGRVSGTLSKLLAMIGFTSTVVVRTLFGRGSDVNVFFSTPPVFAWWGRVLRTVRRQRYVCIVMDVYPDVLVADGRLGADSVSSRLLRLATRSAWRGADAVVVIGRCMRDRVQAAGVDRDRIHLIHNWAADADEPALPIGASELREEHDLHGRFVVEYSGNLGVSHTFDEIIEVARERRSADDAETMFVFIGDGSRRKEIEAARRRHDLDNVALLPFQPAHRLQQSLALADVHLVTLRPGFEGIVVPSKAYSALASGRPLIYVGDSRGEIARIIEDHDVGVVVEPGDVEALGDAILRYQQHPEVLARDGVRAASVARDELGRDRALDAWSALLSGI